ncbi:MAG: ThuA domain-containing protein [Paludisphaera borealis]|uniref:PVC-type heme-binding CxxCH protein n=1 Tax=Paludisphaera borealis TaxID=1387353 RepID=UPI0028427084|nr:PVC-type heme-binding CxxCH protein [Paludisphaera borealis]MDR3619127.1 ThuA domain-containing protein [Paludisphaera borealis]
MMHTLIAFLGLTAAIAAEAPAPTAAEPRPIRVLFLGDRGHHAPADRAAQITPVLALRGIDATYTEKVTDLDPKTLANYDAVLIYANIDEIAPAQEKALLDYVEGGGGFVPIHCASYCFRNAPKYVALVGAQFKSHGEGVFETRVVDAEHPITKGLLPFRTWDETYVHDLHNTEGRHVLQARDQEPWTWTRTQGKGRVFYTAYGHDSRTWEQPGFQDLLERGIRWAAGKPVFDSRPAVASDLKPVPLTEAAGDIPNYLPSGKWGTQGEPYRKMPEPIPASESIKRLVLPNGFEAQLFATEPEIAKPICMAWDHRGRLWIAESYDYPNVKRSRSATGRDRIKICEDRDGDGRAETFTIFADGLNIPTSLCLASGGVIVQQAPDTLFLQDTDGDDKADVRKVLFTGWGTSDTHAGPSNLRWGPDNWIWGIVGYSAFNGTVGGERHQFGQGVYRFKPDGSKLEFLRSTNNNSWGLGFSEEGLAFASTANGCPSVFLAVPNRYYESVRGWSPSVLRSIAATNSFYPVTEKVRQVDFHGGFTAAAGHALYTARNYPKPYWNRTAFVTEPTGHLVATFTLEPKGSDFAAYNGCNLLASHDEWTAPIVAEVGPDGNVWVVDWYNYIVQHNPTPQGFKTGKGGAYETPIRDQTHGRIYRVVHRAGKSAKQAPLDPAQPDALVAALKSDNQFWRLHSQRLLVERGKLDVTPALVALVADPSVDAIGLNPAAIHALWTLQGLKAFDDAGARKAATAALKHPSAGVRRNAIATLPRDAATADAIVAAGLLSDADPQVRLAALLSLADAPSTPDSARGLATALAHGLGEGDHWLTDAATSASAAHAESFLKALATIKAEGEPSAALRTVVERTAEHYARGGPVESVGGLFTAWTSATEQPFGRAIAERVIAGVSKGWPADKPAKLDAESEAALVRLAERLPLEARGRLVNLGSRWGSKAMKEAAGSIAKNLLLKLSDASKPEAERITAGREVVELRPEDDDVAAEIVAQITPRTSPTLATALVEALTNGRARATGKTLLSALGSMTPSTRVVAIRALLGRADWTGDLLDAVDSGAVGWDQFTLDQKQALVAHPSKAVADRAKELIARGGGLPDRDRQAVIDQLAKVVLQGGDPTHGKKVFTDQCAKCHKYNGEGGQVGPDLSGMAAHPKSELLVNIIDPSRSVEGNFVQYSVAMTDGRVLNGLLSSESKTSVELLDAEAKTHVILRDDIDELTASKKSIMPEGFEKQVSASDVADLLAFLTQHGKYLPLDLRKAATVVTTQGMFYASESPVERLIFPDWSTKTFEGVPYQLVDPRGDKTPNAVMLFSPLGAIPPRMPKSVSLPCNTPAKAVHLLSGVSGWGFNGGEARKTVSMIVRLHYADGKVEDHALRDGVEFADYIRVVDVPGSQLAFKLDGRQLRHVRVQPERSEPIDHIELVKGPDHTAPVVMAVTLETE